MQNKLCWGENKKYQNCAKGFWKNGCQADDAGNDDDDDDYGDDHGDDDDDGDGDDDDDLISLNCYARLIPCKMKDQGAIM